MFRAQGGCSAAIHHSRMRNYKIPVHVLKITLLRRTGGHCPPSDLQVPRTSNRKEEKREGRMRGKVDLILEGMYDPAHRLPPSNSYVKACVCVFVRTSLYAYRVDVYHYIMRSFACMCICPYVCAGWCISVSVLWVSKYVPTSTQASILCA